MDRISMAQSALDRIRDRSRDLADGGMLPTTAEIQIMQLNTQGAIALLLMDIAESLRKQAK